MSETETETTETGPSNAELAGRVDGIESKVDLILDKLGGERDQAHDAAERHTEDRLDRPTNMADEIRRQFDEHRAREAADAEKRGQAERLAAVESAVTGMAEKVPETPTRWIERKMGWR